MFTLKHGKVQQKADLLQRKTQPPPHLFLKPFIFITHAQQLCLSVKLLTHNLKIYAESISTSALDKATPGFPNLFIREVHVISARPGAIDIKS